MKAKIISLFFLLSGVSGTLFSTTYYVRSSTGADTYNGLTSGAAFQTLTKVFSGTPALVDGDTVDISGTFDYYVSKVLTKSIVIQGTDKSTAIIQGLAGSATRCFGIGDGTLTPTVAIENITFQNFDNYTASGSQVGGAINVFAGASLTCRNVNFVNNRAYIGGAVNIVSGVANFEDCYFYNNRTTRAGGNNADGGAINVSIPNTVSSNISLTINRCLFEGNSTENIASVLRFTSATTGSTTLLVQNSTFVNNAVVSPSTSTTAGCLYLDVSSTNANTKLINNTIAYNTSVVASARAGISIAGVDDRIILINNILYSNINGSSVNVSISASKKMKETRNNITNQTAYNFDTNTTAGMASNNISSVTALNLALAGALADNGGATKTLTIGANSVAKNTGYTSGAPLIDQRNFTRIGNPDVGAYEYIAFYRSKASGNWSETTSWELSTDNVNWVNATDIPASTDGAISILNGNEIIVNTNSTASDININSGGKLTLNSGYTLGVTGNFSIQSDGTNGTGTFVDKTTNGLTVTGTTTANQYLGTARNWYVSSPITNAKAKTGFTMYRRNEATSNWPTVSTGSEFTPGTGYIALPSATGATISFVSEAAGKFNNENVTVTLTKSGESSNGFNLIGNPYPCHIAWTQTYATSKSTQIEPSIYVRTNSGSSNTGGWSFATYNATTGVAVPSHSLLAGGIIPPMQAFWVKVVTAGDLELNSDLTRSHQSSNPLKAPAIKDTERKLIRLEVSNGTRTDETLLLFDENASDSYDAFDSPKFAEANTEVQIYTTVGTEKLVMNGMKTIPFNQEIGLNFVPGNATLFSMKANEINNLPTGVKVILKDNATKIETDLTDGIATYQFVSEVSNNNRFSLIFRTAESATGVDKNENPNSQVFVNAANQIVVVAPEKAVYGIYNAVGCKLKEVITTASKYVDNSIYKSGVYMVETVVDGKREIHKAIIR